MPRINEYNKHKEKNNSLEIPNVQFYERVSGYFLILQIKSRFTQTGRAMFRIKARQKATKL